MSLLQEAEAGRPQRVKAASCCLGLRMGHRQWLMVWGSSWVMKFRWEQTAGGCTLILCKGANFMVR